MVTDEDAFARSLYPQRCRPPAPRAGEDSQDEDQEQQGHEPAPGPTPVADHGHGQPFGSTQVPGEPDRRAARDAMSTSGQRSPRPLIADWRRSATNAFADPSPSGISPGRCTTSSTLIAPSPGARRRDSPRGDGPPAARAARRRIHGGVVAVAVRDPSRAVEKSLRGAIGRPVRRWSRRPTGPSAPSTTAYRATGVSTQIKAFEARDACGGRQPAERIQGNEEAPVVRVVPDGHHPGAARPRLRHPHRAAGRPRPGPLPHRRRAARRARPARPMGPAVVSRIKIMADMNIVERRRPQDGQIAHGVDGRTSTSASRPPRSIWGEKVVLRLLDKSRSLLPARASSACRAETAERTRRSIRSPYGMVICAGPTG